MWLGVVVLAFAAFTARSVALFGFGLDSLIEIGASIVVLWELADAAMERRRRALRLIGAAFAILAAYLGAQSTIILVAKYHPHHSPLGVAWTGITAVVMFVLAAGKASVGTALSNPVLRAESRVTAIDGILAVAVCVGLVLNAWLGCWWLIQPPATFWSITALGKHGGSSPVEPDGMPSPSDAR
jgi:divalent metal cation (Fe/Co/Zn/Cd) transporter